MYRNRLEESSARWRQWDASPEQAPLEVQSWPLRAQLFWGDLATSVRNNNGVIAMPRSVMSFAGPVTCFFVDGEVQRTLQFATMVRTYPLVCDCDETPRRGISRQALAAVVVARFGIRATPMLVPVFDDVGIHTMMLLDYRPPERFFELGAAARPRGQQPASVVVVRDMEATGSNIAEVAARMARRLDRDIGPLPFAHGIPACQASSSSNVASSRWPVRRCCLRRDPTGSRSGASRSFP